jgi:hypothetical protein
MATGLTRDLIAEAMKKRGEFPPIEAAWELQAGITSSLTR